MYWRRLIRPMRVGRCLWLDVVRVVADGSLSATVAPGLREEVAELVAWLASEACTFSTGAVFDLSGGRATY